jgi:signal transduction histidine kinase
MADIVTEKADGAAVERRALELLGIHQQEIWRRTDRLFVRLLLLEWVAAVVFALIFTPTTWAGAARQIHPHVWQALLTGGAIFSSPAMFARWKPGAAITRHVIAVAQMLCSALLIHVGGGRIEMHFHVFGSLAFLAFYRDWRVLISASVVVAMDHLLRGMFIPQSVFGIASASNWRWLEHAAWVIFEDVFLIASCAKGVREMRDIAERQALLEESHRTVEEKVRERTRQLEDLQQDMVKVARSAGMAEIATSVLHNVGNVLNSLNVSLNIATQRVQQSPVVNLAKATRMLEQHQEDLPAFLTADPRGRQIPGYLMAVSEALSGEQGELLSEMESLAKNVEHIKEIVNVQQSHAKGTGMRGRVHVESVIEDALQVTMGARDQQGIELCMEIEELPEILTDKHALLQILINLTGNAKHAMAASGRKDMRLTVRASRCGAEGGRVRLEIVDNGVGIEAANLTRIFNHGFTTKKDGHGFGLHSSALAARQLGGSLSVQSEGPGTGATFTLELPLEQELVTT